MSKIYRIEQNKLFYLNVTDLSNNPRIMAKFIHYSKSYFIFFRGTVINPTLSFSTLSIDFGILPVGKYKLYISLY